MAITDNKIVTWTTPIASEADQPVRTASAMKAVFDSNSNQLKTALNALIDSISAATAANEIGAAAFDDVAEGTIQAQLEALRALIDERVETITIGTVTTGAAGSSASVTVTGTATDVVLNFTIPKGDTGDPTTSTPATLGALARTGIEDGAATMLWRDGSFFCITPTYIADDDDFTYYQNGTRYINDGDVATMSTAGAYLFYLVGADWYGGGALKYILNPTYTQRVATLIAYPTAAMVYWNGTSIDMIIDMRYGTGQTGVDKVLESPNESATLINDGGGLFADFAATEGDNADAAKFSIAATKLWNLDIKHEHSAASTSANMPVLHLVGTTKTFTTSTGGYKVLRYSESGRLAYNLNTAGTWSKAEVPADNYVLYHYFATGASSYDYLGSTIAATPYFALMGQSYYATIAEARAAADTEAPAILASGIVPPRSCLLGTVIFRTGDYSSTGTNAYVVSYKPGIAKYKDWRGVDTTLAQINAELAGKQAAMTAGTDYLAPTTPVTVVSVTESKTFALTDINTFQACSHATTPIVLTVPKNTTVDIPVGSCIAVSMDGAAQVSFAAAADVTINPSTTLKISEQYKTAALIKTATNTWVLSGSLKA